MSTQNPLEVLNVTPPTDISADTTENTVGAPVKSSAPTKGGISPVGTTLLNPQQTAELLANMENMIAQKTGVFHGMMSGIQDALAFATPQDQLPLALQYRNEQKRQEAQDVFGMRQQMAALQASAGQAQAQREAMDKILGGGGGAQPQGGAGTAPDIFGGKEIPPEVRQQIAMDPVNGPEILKQYLKTAATERTKARLNPAWYEMTEVIGANGQIEKVPRIQAVELAMQNPNNPVNRAVIKTSSELSTAAAGAPQLRPQGNAASIAQGLGIPVISGYRSPEKQAELYEASQKPGYAGPPVAKPGSSQHQQGNAIDVDSRRMTPEVRQKLIDNGFVQPLPKTDPNHWELAGAREKLAAPSQVAGPAQATTSAPPRAMPGESVESLKQRQALWAKTQEKQTETDISTAAKSGEQLRTDAGKMMGAVMHNAKNADEVIKTADRVIKHAMTRPDEFGYAYQQENPILAGFANAPMGIGQITEKSVPAMFGNKGESGRRADTDKDASKLGLDFAAQMFSGTGARLGVGLEQMAANAKGVGTEFPANTNALNANLVKVAAQKAKDTASEWDKWAETHGGINADPNKFIQSPEYKNLSDKWDKKLVEFDKQMQKTFPDVYQPYKKAEDTEKKNRKPLGQILGVQ